MIVLELYGVPKAFFPVADGGGAPGPNAAQCPIGAAAACSICTFCAEVVPLGDTIMTVLNLALACATTLVFLAAGAVPASAQEATHGCACVHNKTSSVVSFRYKWGDGEWRTVAAKPNYKNWMCWKYGSAKTSPDLVFQLDVDLTTGNAWTAYKIARVQTKKEHCDAVGKGGHYNISYRPNTNNAFIQVTKRP